MGRLDTIGHRPRRDVRGRRRLHRRASRSAFLDYIAVGRLVPERRGRAGRRHRGRLPPGGLRAGRRRDRGAPGPDGARRVRPRRVLHRASGSGPAAGRAARRAPATRSWASPRPGCTPTATRWCARSSPTPSWPLDEPYEALVARVLGRGGSVGARPRPDLAGDPGDVLLHADPDLRDGPAGDPRGAGGGRPRGPRAWRTSPAAACRATCRARWPGAPRRAAGPGRLADARGDARAGGAGRASRTPSCGRRSTPGSAWSLVVARGRGRDAALAWLAAAGSRPGVVGEVGGGGGDRRRGTRRMA